MREHDRMYSRGSKLLPLALLCVCLLWAFAVPYVHDDWDWGSQGGLKRLSTFFHGYNGRYAGNLLIMALTRSVLLKTAVGGLALFVTFMLLGGSLKDEQIPLVILGAILFFTMSEAMAQQSIGWLSAFCNYGVGTLFILVFMKQAFSRLEGRKASSPFLCIGNLLLGTIGALFMENITVALLILSLMLCIYTAVRDRRLDGAVFSFFIGTCIGAVAMFSNSVYGSIAGNHDFYRTIAFYYWDDMGALLDQIRWIYRNRLLRFLLNENIPLLFAVSGFALLAASKLRAHFSPCRKMLCNGVLVALILYPIYVLITMQHSAWEAFLSYTGRMDEIFGLIYIGAIIALPLILPLECTKRLRMGLLLFAIGLLSAPLLVVTPVDARCFYPMFVLEIAYILELARVCGWQESFGIYRLPLVATLAMLSFFWLSIYGRNAMVSDMRAKAAQEEAASGQTTIRLAQLPYEGYSWISTPNGDTKQWYKSFYNLPEDLIIDPVPYEIWYKEHK